MKKQLAILSLCAHTGAAHAAVLNPTDPSVNSSLGLWLTDAANNFDGSTWSDSSGNGNHATTVGTVNINGPVTYSAPTLDILTTTVDHNTSSIAFTGSVDDLMRASAINGGSGTNELTIFAVYNVATFNGSTTSNTRTVGFGSIAGTQVNSGDNFNLASDPSIRKDNGQIGANNYNTAFPVGTSFIRIARMDAGGVDEWFNTSIALNPVITNFGTAFTTSTDDFYLGDLRAGATVIPGVVGATSTSSDFSISQVIVYNSALSDAQIAGINEFIVTPVPEPSSLGLLGISALGLMRRRR